MTVQDEAVVDQAVNQANGMDPWGDFPPVDVTQEFSPSVSAGQDAGSPNLGQRTDDPDAPYGRTKSGAPRKKPGPSKGSRFGAAAGNGPPKPGRRSGPARPRASARTGTDYRAGIIGILQIPAFALSAAGQMNEDLALDGAAISMYAPGIAEALSDLANDQPVVAAALDRILTAGPYGAILGACIPLAMQIAANHRAVPDAVAQSMGAQPREVFKAHLIAAQGT